MFFVQDVTREGDGKGVEADQILPDSYDGNVRVLCPPGLLVHDVNVLLMGVLGVAEFGDRASTRFGSKRSGHRCGQLRLGRHRSVSR